MLSQINFLFMISLAFVSWVLLCYIHYLGDLRNESATQVTDEDNIVIIEEPFDQSEIQNLLDNVTKKHYTCYFNYGCIFVCLYLMANISVLIDQRKVKRKIYVSRSRSKRDSLESLSNANSREILTSRAAFLRQEVLRLQLELTAARGQHSYLLETIKRQNSCTPSTQIQNRSEACDGTENLPNLFDNLPTPKQRVTNLPAPNIPPAFRTHTSVISLRANTEEKPWNMNHGISEKALKAPSIPNESHHQGSGLLDRLQMEKELPRSFVSSHMHQSEPNSQDSEDTPAIYLSNERVCINRRLSFSSSSCSCSCSSSGGGDEISRDDGSSVSDNLTSFSEMHIFSKTRMVVPLPKKILDSGEHEYKIVDMDDAEAIMRIVKELEEMAKRT